MTTNIQTVEITMPGSTNVVLSLEKYPVCPIRFIEYQPLYLDASNGDVYCWYPNGDASILSKDGTRRYFWSKPIMNDVICNLHGQYDGNYTRFFKDGSVENKINNVCYWWGPSIDGQSTEGETFEICSYCAVKNCYDKCIDYYDKCDLCGDDKCYETCQSENYI
jgi:hypothetical protein